MKKGDHGAGLAARRQFEQAQGGPVSRRIATCLWGCRQSFLEWLEAGESNEWRPIVAIQVDVRVIVGRHRNLESLVKQGAFRQDLYTVSVVFR